ncbi:MAG TPA: hypothetical protein VJI46_04750 [Candidatus Nanoarchaeia archaeon]|nr:hypothetical protein [Candidatus Nanoarchaeia archaeon]
MDGDEEDWEKRLEKVSLTKRCPKCNGLSLRYNEKLGKIVCDDCGFETSMPKM